MTRKLYAAMMLVERMELVGRKPKSIPPRKIPFQFQDHETGIVGMIPVFDTYSQASKSYPKAMIFEIITNEVE